MARAREDRIGRYELLIELGHGGMAELFLGRLHGAGGFAKLVAIKRILPHLAKDEQFREMFLDEGRIASHLSHPNVCQVFELDDSDGDLFLAMEYLDGVGWDQLLAAVPIGAKAEPPLTLAAGILAQAADGLHYAHTLRDAEGNATPVVHRDVSPQNLFVTIDGVCKVLDFGVSKMMTDGPRTKSGVVKGKLPYMAPEQIRGEPVDARTDVFSLGVCLWEALAGERLYDRATDFLIWKAVTEEDAPLITSRWPGCPLSIEGLLRKTLTREATDRIGSAREFAEQLRAAVPQLASSATIADTVRAACAERLATRAKQVATAISQRRSIPIDDDGRRTPTPFERPTPDPAMSAAETMESGRSAAMTMDERPRIDPGRTADLRSRAARLRDESDVHETASPAAQLRDKSADRADDEIRLRDKSHVVARESDEDLRKTSEHPSGARRLRERAEPPLAGATVDHLEVTAQKHNRVGLIIGGIAAALVLIVVIFIATRSPSSPSTPPPVVDPPNRTELPGAKPTGEFGGYPGKPGDTKPGDTKPGDAKPGDAKPGDTKPGDAKPNGEFGGYPGDKPGDAKPTGSKPTDGKPTDGKPGDAKQTGAKPGDAKQTGAKPGEAKPGDAKANGEFGGYPGDPKSGKPGGAKSGDAKSADAKSGDAKPTGPKPTDPKPTDPKPTNPTSDQSKPATTEPAFLSIASEPYATIFVDGKKLGDTPLFRAPIAAGKHTIRAVRADGREKTFAIDVAPNKEHNAGKLTW